MTHHAWSHSSLKDYEGCPRRYHEVKVLKKYPFQTTEATRYGNQVHQSLELYVRDNKPLPPEHAQFKPVVDAMLKKPGRKMAEQELALTIDLKPTDWKSPDVWVRGIVDILILDDDNMTAWIGDWKTGKDRYPDRDQLVLMSLMVFAHFPHIRKIHSALLFIVKESMVTMQMHRDQVDQFWAKYRERTDRLEKSFEHAVWNPTQTPLCGWCQVTGCEFNPKH